MGACGECWMLLTDSEQGVVVAEETKEIPQHGPKSRKGNVNNNQPAVSVFEVSAVTFLTLRVLGTQARFELFEAFRAFGRLARCHNWGGTSNDRRKQKRHKVEKVVLLYFVPFGWICRSWPNLKRRQRCQSLLTMAENGKVRDPRLLMRRLGRPLGLPPTRTTIGAAMRSSRLKMC